MKTTKSQRPKRKLTKSELRERRVKRALAAADSQKTRKRGRYTKEMGNIGKQACLAGRLTDKQMAMLHEDEIKELQPKLKWQTNQFVRRRGSCDARFDWTPKRLLAARLLATSELTMQEVADTIGVSKQTVYYWRTFSTFDRMVERLVLETGFANEPERVSLSKNLLRSFST